MRPGPLIGAYAQGAAKETDAAADRNFKELQAQFESAAVGPPFDLLKELRPPLDIVGWGVELTPVEYLYTIKSGPATKTIMITSPLKWVLSYSGLAPGKLTSTGYNPRRMRELLANRSRSTDELRQFLIHYILINMAVNKQPGLQRVFADLRFPLSTERFDEFGKLPFTCVSTIVGTVRPPDDTLLEMTEISGKDAFEEVVNEDDIRTLSDPLGTKILALAKQYNVGQP